MARRSAITASRLNQYWTLIAILLIAVIAISGVVAYSRYNRSQSIEISISATPELQGEINISQTEEQEQPQKIDLNLAEAWLLESLPGIGETRARAIIDYRQQNGLFNNINELTKVEGIGVTTYEKIKHLITVAD